MKKYILFLTVAIIAGTVFISAKDTGIEDKEGIQFFQGSWQEAIQKAQKENKPIFLDIYATWCGPCKMLKRNTFSDKKVAELYNKTFINVSIDGEKGEGALLAAKYQITGYPTLLYFNKTGTPVLHTAGYVEPDDFISIGREVLKINK